MARDSVAGVLKPMDDATFLADVTRRLADLAGVQAVALGGSRGTGEHRPGSDWDLGIYYRSGLDPAELRAVGWPGEVSEIGGWGGGVFNGGAWLQIDGRHVDVHYRDLDDVELQVRRAERGEFDVEHLAFHLAGIPSYLVVAELALCRVVHGTLPRVVYPEALRASATARWSDTARMTLAYARAAYAAGGRVAECAGAITRAACEAAHGVLAARKQWITNEKTLLDKAGLRPIDEVLVGLGTAPEMLTAAVDRAAVLVDGALAPGAGPGA